MGKRGREAKRDKADKVVETRKLTGVAGQSLYLECLQLLLRQQIAWLVDVKGYSGELELVVKDLWDIRTRGAPSARKSTESDGNESEVSVFSSHSEADSSDYDSSTRADEEQSQRWGRSRGRGWQNPRPMDTLALCYLGGLLLRLPLRVGQIQRWAADGLMPFRRVVRSLILSPVERRIDKSDIVPRWMDCPER